MTVKELREQLSKFDADTDVVVLWEQDDDSQLFDIDNVSLQTGTPVQVKGKPKFKYDMNGPIKKLFISVTPDF